MPRLPPASDLAAAVEAFAACGNKAEAARRLGVNVNTLKARLEQAERRGIVGGAVAAPVVAEAVGGVEPPAPATQSERERILSDEVKRLKSELGRKQRGEERLILEAREALDEMEIRPWTLPPPPAAPSSSRPVEHLILMISDTQLGKTTATFDLAVAEQRMMAVAHRFLKVAEIRSAHAEIGSVTLYFGGDAVEGEQIYGGQHWHVEVGVGPQSTAHGPALHSRLAALIASHSPRPVRVRCVTGNHGRVGAINLPSSPQTNWDRVCYEVTRLMLDRLAPGAFDYGIADDWYLVDRLPGGWGVLLTHGDMIGGGGSSASIIGKASAWAETIPEPWDYLMLGHFHRAWSLQTRGGTREIYVNGSIESDDSDFVRGRMAVGGRPSQRMFVLDEDRGIIEAPILYPEPRKPMASHYRTGAA